MDMKSSIWTREELIDAVTPIKINGGDFNSSGVSIDTRSLKSGEVFIALTGQNSNGHDYINRAIMAGASAVVIDNSEHLNKYKIPTVLVKNCEEALNQLATFRRNQSKAKIIAITGSVGKTSTKEALFFVLKNFGRTYATQGNYNNHLGVPLSLSNMHRSCDYGIFEIGTSNPGEILPLSKLVKPDIAVLTAIAAAHLQNFDSIEDIAKEKLSIIGGLSKDGILFYNGITCDNYIQNLTVKNENYTKFYRDFQNRTINQQYLNINYKGYHFEFPNLQSSAVRSQIILSVLTLCDYLHLDINKACTILNNLQMPKGRGKISKLNIPATNSLEKNSSIDMIDDSYNANPLSMTESIRFATNYAKGQNKKLTLIVGDMLELGSNEIKYHEELKSLIDTTVINRVITVGSLMNFLKLKIENNVKSENFADSRHLEKNLFDILDQNSVLLIKGSHSTGLYRIAEQLLKFETTTLKEIEDKDAL
ncbi:MAG: UDP-N-acetylmuramoyl-tripeptide--D-alanyl-D-alanine ligase [Candidatus Pacebacteria bacterium]|nr:UDP-N-acetylmuramoyl-tripeptide--D-alanyl-D-alanine ligase [Candidatus Paceibacterota bacterium]